MIKRVRKQMLLRKSHVKVKDFIHTFIRVFAQNCCYNDNHTEFIYLSQTHTKTSSR